MSRTAIVIGLVLLAGSALARQAPVPLIYPPPREGQPWDDGITRQLEKAHRVIAADERPDFDHIAVLAEWQVVHLRATQARHEPGNRQAKRTEKDDLLDTIAELKALAVTPEQKTRVEEFR